LREHGGARARGRTRSAGRSKRLSRLCRDALERRYFLSYFHMRCLPSLIHSIAVASRRCRVASVFASVSHWMSSRLWLGLKSSNVAFAFLFFASAARRYAGATSGFFAAADFFD